MSVSELAEKLIWESEVQRANSLSPVNCPERKRECNVVGAKRRSKNQFLGGIIYFAFAIFLYLLCIFLSFFYSLNRKTSKMVCDEAFSILRYDNGKIHLLLVW